jgi:alpha-beta hydrolase superfamily lysophospholipase
MKSAALAAFLAVTATCLEPSALQSAFGETAAPLAVRGHVQPLHVYGQRGGVPVVLMSGDGGWIHLAPHVATLLASRGYFVVGLDARHYLESFTTTGTTLSKADIPLDVAAVVHWAAEGGSARPVLAGVSEGAALAVLAATDPSVQHATSGVMSMGLPTVAELAWRWTDSWIYLSHGVPNEPLFGVTDVIDRVAPLPLVAIYATHDEYVSTDDARRLVAKAGEPKQLWIVPASNHRFSDNEPELDRHVLDAMVWIREHST